jgi:hypothetical protein
MKQSHLESNEGETGPPQRENPRPKLTSRKAWSAYWLPIFQALTTQCTNPCREVRHLAFASMQRSLLSPELTSADHEEWTAIFGEVLFPLILRLLKPEVFSSDRDGMSETRVQAASLLCKVFLQYLVILSKWEGMLDLWLRVIEIMDRLMNSGQGDSLVSSFPVLTVCLLRDADIVVIRRRPSPKISRTSCSSCRATAIWFRRAETPSGRSCGTRRGSGLIGSCPI